MSSVDYSHITGACRVLELQYGHFRSRQEQRAVDKEGRSIPWFTYPAIDYLDQLDLTGKTMLEWGSGNSSQFFSGRVRHLCSIEHNPEWHSQVKAFNLPNQELALSDEPAYAAAAKNFGRSFDIILIDGVEREACAAIALTLLTPKGFIILDNSDRHPDIAEGFRKQDLIEIDFHGLGPINNYTWTTSLFLRRDFSCEPLGRQPKVPIGGGY